jgi:hypothetical protein
MPGVIVNESSIFAGRKGRSDTPPANRQETSYKGRRAGAEKILKKEKILSRPFISPLPPFFPGRKYLFVVLIYLVNLC